MSNFDKTQYISGLTAFNLLKIEDAIEAAIGFNNVEEIRALGTPSYLRSAVLSNNGATLRYNWSNQCAMHDDGIRFLLPTGHSGQGRWIVQGDISPIFFGAIASFALEDIKTNTTAIQAANDAIGDLPSTIKIPSGVYYDWRKISLCDQTTIIDNSGYDAAASTGRIQAYTRYYHRTSGSTGRTNGNTFWLTADYHPAYVTHTIALESEKGARGSFINWIGTKASPTRLGTQWGTDFTGDNKEIVIAGYDNTTSPVIATKLLKIAHPNDHENSGATSFGGDLISGYTQNIYLAGLFRNRDRLTKNMVLAKTLPPLSSAKIDQLWLRGKDVIHREQFGDEVKRFFYKPKIDRHNFEAIRVSQIGEQSGGLDLHIDLEASDSGIPETFINRTIYNNRLFTKSHIKSTPFPSKGDSFKIIIASEHGLRLTTPTEGKFVSGITSMQSNTPGSFIEFYCYLNGTWAFNRSGTWTDS